MRLLLAQKIRSSVKLNASIFAASGDKSVKSCIVSWEMEEKKKEMEGKFEWEGGGMGLRPIKG